MDRRKNYFVMQEQIAGEKWGVIHLFDLKPGTKTTLDLRASKCGVQTSGDGKRFRSFGRRKEHDESGFIKGAGNKLRICADCERVRLEEPETRLWCIQYEERGISEDEKVTWIPQEPEYFDATDYESAQEMILGTFPGRTIRVIGIAPAIGFHVEDEEGLILSA